MDESANDLVLKTFVKLYNDKLIYQADKLVNWDIKLKTAISDIEVINKETPSKMYYFKYEIVDSKEYLIVATTRPETMFGDIGLFVNPNDKRYKKYIGKYAINPVNGEKLKIYSDEYIDITFGTGVMKCTPAHDFNDYELAKKHNIVEYYSVFNFDGTLNDKCGKFVGMDRLIARPKIVEWIKEKDLLIKIENHKSNIGYSERTNEVIEPLISKQ
ncbi:hypothetical protein FACS189459_0170 [Bacilli bacterium]|nr:hypothetical protein FACS189459_0170 [Bacilli bacterium]